VSSKELAPVQAKADGAHTEEGICFPRQTKAGRDFVPANIQRPDDHGPLVHDFSQLAQGFELFLFAWSIDPIQEQKLGAKEPDAFRAAFQGVSGLSGMTKVRQDPDCMAICCDRALMAESSNPLRFPLESFLAFAQVLQFGRSRVEPEFTACAVECRGCHDVRRLDAGTLEG
jgi:hypothetical protein